MILKGIWVIHDKEGIGEEDQISKYELFDISDLEHVKKIPRKENSKIFFDFNFPSLKVFDEKRIFFNWPNCVALYQTSTKRVRFSKNSKEFEKIYFFGRHFLKYLKKDCKVLKLRSKKQINVMNCQSLKMMKSIILKRAIKEWTSPVISKCEKYLFLLVNSKTIHSFSLLDVCKTRVIINLDFKCESLAMGWTNLYFNRGAKIPIITYFNMVDFLKKNMNNY